MSKFKIGDIVRVVGGNTKHVVMGVSDGRCWTRACDRTSPARYSTFRDFSLVLVKSADEAPEQESARKGHKGHPHAALMAEYAKDAAETDKPWERWQYRCRGNDKWHNLGNLGPSWLRDTEYRRKPVEKWVNLYSRAAGGMSVLSTCGYEVGGNFYDTEEAALRCADDTGHNGYIGTVKIEVPAK